MSEKKPLHQRKDLKYLNIFSDFILLIMAFTMAGWLRKYSLFGDTFYWKDVQTFQPLAFIYAITMTACYALQGCYQSLHIRNYRRETLKIGIINILGLLLTAAVLFVFQLSQFSRLWLAYFYVISTLVIVIKRVLVDRAATSYEVRHNFIPNAILIGSGNLALRFYYTVASKDAASMHYVGNVADCKNDSIPNYLGTMEDLAVVISARQVDVIIVAEDYQNVEHLERILAIATNHKIRVCVIPIYTDLISNKTGIQSVFGIHMIDLQLLDTCEIMGLNVAVTNTTKTIDMIHSQLENWRGHYICIASVKDAVDGYEDSQLREIQNHAVMTLPAGNTLFDYNRKHGYAAAEQISGSDLMSAILAQSKENHWKHYFVGSDFQVLNKLQDFIRKKYEGIEIVGSYSLPSDTLSISEDQIITQAIINANADFVWVNLSSPQQECWMAAHENRFQSLMIGVGDTFERMIGQDTKPHGLLPIVHRWIKSTISKVKYVWWDWN